MCRSIMQLRSHFCVGRGVEPSHTFVPHTCNATRVDLASHDASRKNKLLYFANLDSALQFIVDKGRDASPADLEKKLTEDRHYVTYQTCVDACTWLKAQFFNEDRTHYQFILSYDIEMNKSGHKAHILRCVTTKYVGSSSYTRPSFMCFAILQIAVSIWMAHLRGMHICGHLLVACLINSKNKIQMWQ